MNKTQAFLLKHHETSSEIDIEEKIEQFIADMHSGLEGKGGPLPMIPTYLCDIDRSKIVPDVKRILIDAGGTNFRSAVGHFDQTGHPVIDYVMKTVMPAVDRELSKDEFYTQIADNVAYLLPKAGDIGFCFSYQVDMDKDIDGLVTVFSKEVKAPEVVGTRVGQCTLDAIEKIDGNKRRIVILNDTVATLLGGMATDRGKYCTYIGYIFGTGTNLCYIEKTENITKVNDLPVGSNMLINMECGNFDKFTRGDFDNIVINHTAQPERQPFEKMTSGKYLADIIAECIKGAVDEGLFTSHVSMVPFVLKDVSEFLCDVQGIIYNMFGNNQDRNTAKEICNELIDRAARMGAIANASAAIVAGTPNDKPVAIVAEGTTFDKLPGYRSNFEKYLDHILIPRNISYRIVQGKELNLVGTLMATMALK